MDGGLAGDVAHLHQDESDHSSQHEARKTQQENAVHGKQRGCQHHQKRDGGEEIVITVAVRRKQPHHHDKQNQVNRRVEKPARKQEIIGQVESHVSQGQKRGPALRNEPGTPLISRYPRNSSAALTISTVQQAQSSGRGQGAKTCKYHQIEGNLKVTLHALRAVEVSSGCSLTAEDMAGSIVRYDVKEWKSTEVQSSVFSRQSSANP